MDSLVDFLKRVILSTSHLSELNSGPVPIVLIFIGRLNRFAGYVRRFEINDGVICSMT